MYRDKVLFFQWKSFMNHGISSALQALGIDYGTFFYQFRDWEQDEKFLERFRGIIGKGEYGKVFSVNFSPLISDVCEEFGIPYIAWIYDSPVHIRNIEKMKHSSNVLYFFDRGQAEAYQNMGIAAKSLPLAADIKWFEQKIAAGKQKTRHRISMLGTLYQTEYLHFTRPLNGYLRGYLEGVLNAQSKLYGAYLLPELISEELLCDMNRIYQNASSDGFQMGKRELEFLLAQEVTGRERYMALALLSSHFPVDVYTEKKDAHLKNVRFHGYADYETKMPLIFAHSDINLNISLKCIRTGIPLRVIEAMGCGGFVLSNYQEELLEYFKLGEECEAYGELEELYAKAKFYLAHEELRAQIARRGLERIRRDFTFEERLKTMLRSAGD